MFLRLLSLAAVVRVNQWSIRTVIEPVPKIVEAIINQIFRCSEVEPGIDCSNQQRHRLLPNYREHTLMNDTLKPDNRKQSACNCSGRNCA